MKDEERQDKEVKPNLYPNCDTSIWLRSLEEEISEPIKGKVIGTIPNWLNGSLLRNGPGRLKVGEMTFKHLFDSSALIHRQLKLRDKYSRDYFFEIRGVQVDTLKVPKIPLACPNKF